MSGEQSGLGAFGPVFLLCAGQQGPHPGIRIPGNLGSMLAVGLTVFYLVDFIHCLRLRMGGMEEEEPVIGRLKVY